MAVRAALARTADLFPRLPTMKNLATICVAVGVAVLSAAIGGKSLAAGRDGSPNTPRDAKGEINPPTGVGADFTGRNWDSALPGWAGSSRSDPRGALLAADENKPGTNSADRIVCVVFLLLALGGVTALAAYWILRRRSGRFGNGIARGGGVVPFP